MLHFYLKQTNSAQNEYHNKGDIVGLLAQVITGERKKYILIDYRHIIRAIMVP